MSDHRHLVLAPCAPHLAEFSRVTRQDDYILQEALEAQGMTVQCLVWNDPGVDWDVIGRWADLVVVRSTWDYHHDLKAFLAWAEKMAGMTTLLNPLPVIRWNTNKRYLRALARHGVPIIPTAWVRRGASLDLTQLLAQRGWARAVIKPAVSVNAYATILVDAKTIDTGLAQAHLDTHLLERDMMIQPFIASITSEGEHSVVMLAGQPTHAFRRQAALCTEADAMSEGPIVVSAEEVRLARSILRVALDLLGIPAAALPFARVDLVNDAGQLRLMEIELVEPRLRLDCSAEALDRLVQSLAVHSQFYKLTSAAPQGRSLFPARVLHTKSTGSRKICHES